MSQFISFNLSRIFILSNLYCNIFFAFFDLIVKQPSPIREFPFWVNWLGFIILINEIESHAVLDKKVAIFKLLRVCRWEDKNTFLIYSFCI